MLAGVARPAGQSGALGRRGRGGGPLAAGKEPSDASDRISGREVKRVYVEEGCDIARELYLALIDRETGG
jgi:succinyl-CoA synthetase beta subunit